MSRERKTIAEPEKLAISDTVPFEDRFLGDRRSPKPRLEHARQRTLSGKISAKRTKKPGGSGKNWEKIPGRWTRGGALL